MRINFNQLSLNLNLNLDLQVLNKLLLLPLLPLRILQKTTLKEFRGQKRRGDAASARKIKLTAIGTNVASLHVSPKTSA